MGDMLAGCAKPFGVSISLKINELRGRLTFQFNHKETDVSYALQLFSCKMRRFFFFAYIQHRDKSRKQTYCSFRLLESKCTIVFIFNSHIFARFALIFPSSHLLGIVPFRIENKSLAFSTSDPRSFFQS